MPPRQSSTLLFALAPALAATYFGCTSDFDRYAATQASGSGGAPATTSGSTGGGVTSSTTASTSASASTSATTSSTISATTSSTVSTSSTTSSTVSTGTGSCTSVDCSNPACAGTYACVANAPTGWNGPIMLYDGDPASAPSCPPSHPTLAYTWHGDLVPEPAKCADCTCIPTDPVCTPAPLQLSNDVACATTSATVAQPASGSCGPMSPPSGTKAISASPPKGGGGSCTPDGGGKTLPPPKWARAGIACIGGGLGGGCGSGQICAPAAEAPFEPGLCIWATGTKSCPSAFPSKHSFSSSVSDTRDCTSCTCGKYTPQCTATTSVYATAQCAGTSVDVPNDGSCVPGSGASLKVTMTGSASCPPDGGQPVGTITAAGLGTTVCCAP